jgi:bifunctional DNA-binding transcriptional regulator/antitoxin component of YhaV-PrlF toxin-antitoxin module
MSKVTSKLQVTLPKAIADRYGVAPGADLVFEPAGESIRVLVAREGGVAPTGASLADKQALFDAATRRQARRNRKYGLKAAASGRRRAKVERGRGWSREELYDR